MSTFETHVNLGNGQGAGTATAPLALCRLFLVARNRLLREALSRILMRPGDFSIIASSDFVSNVLDSIHASKIDIVLLDGITSAPADLDLLCRLHSASPQIKIILIGMEDDEQLFLRSIQAGALGYVLKEASALDVVSAVRSVAGDEAVCPPRLCLSLFHYLSRTKPEVPNSYLRQRLGLTRREQQLIPLIARGLTNKEIASHLHLSEQTIKNHIHRMLQKMGANDRLSAVELCRHHSLGV